MSPLQQTFVCLAIADGQQLGRRKDHAVHGEQLQGKRVGAAARRADCEFLALQSGQVPDFAAAIENPQRLVVDRAEGYQVGRVGGVA
jgi:hypothetical protein